MNDEVIGEAISDKGFIIAIDGPGGVGKSSVSRRVAEELGGIYVDTGAMYRAFAMALAKAKVNADDETALARFCSDAEIVYRPISAGIFINNVDYSDKIRSEKAGALASAVASKSIVRRTLVAYQRSFRYEGILVMEGRDIGTKVFPSADIKFFLDADPEVRARRRHNETRGSIGAGETERVLRQRDRQDRERADSPLEKAEDAIYVDTSAIDMEEVLSLIMAHIKKRLFPSGSGNGRGGESVR